MSRWLVAAFALAVGNSSAISADRPLPNGAARFERAVIVDPAGQSHPVAAGTMFLPLGWRPQGGIAWGPQFACTYYLGMNWVATSPDGQSKVAWLPAGSWEQNNTGNPTPTRPGCTMQPFSDARSYLIPAVNVFFPGARILDYQPRRDLARIPAPITRPGPGGMQITNYSDAGQVRFAFQQDGTEMHGVLVVGVNFEVSQTPTPGIGMLRMLYATTDALFAATAPSGRFDPALFEALRASFEVDPAWLRAVADHARQIDRINLNGIMDRQRIWQGTAQQISQMISQSWQANQRSSDERALAFSRAFRGVEVYHDASGRPVELSGGFSAAWRLEDGTYLMSRDVNFDPWRDAGLVAEKLQPQR